MKNQSPIAMLACFGFDMPYGGKWERKFVPVDADKAAQIKPLLLA